MTESWVLDCPGRVEITMENGVQIVRCVIEEPPLNLVPNGDFETGTDFPADWKRSANGEAGFLWDHSIKHSGGYSGRIRTNNGALARWLTDYLPVQAGQQIAVEGWLRTNLTRGSAFIVLNWWAGTTYLKNAGTSMEVSGLQDWIRLEIPGAVVPANANRMRVELRSWNSHGDAWWDDVRAWVVG